MTAIIKKGLGFVNHILPLEGGTEVKEERTFEMACRFITETDAAVLIVDPADTSETELWIPLSQVHEMHRDKSGYGTIVMSEWIARKKGLA